MNGDSGSPLLHDETGFAFGIISRYGFAAMPPSTDTGPMMLYVFRELEAAGSGPLPGGRRGVYGPTSGWLDTGLATEEISRNDPWSNDGNPGEGPGGQGYYSLAFQTPPLTEGGHIAGSAVLEGRFNYLPVAGATLTPILVDIDEDDRYRTIQRGFLNIDYRDGLGSQAPTPSGWIDATITFLPEDYTVAEEHRLGVLLQSSNAVWAVPGNPAGFVSVFLSGTDHAGTRLHLPLVSASERIHDGFGDRPRT